MGWQRRMFLHGPDLLLCPFLFSCFIEISPIKLHHRLWLENSPQFQPHPAQTEPPCESVVTRVVCMLWVGGSSWLKKGGVGLWPCPAVVVATRTMHAGWQFRLLKNHWVRSWIVEVFFLFKSFVHINLISPIISKVSDPVLCNVHCLLYCLLFLKGLWFCAQITSSKTKSSKNKGDRQLTAGWTVVSLIGGRSNVN